MKVKFESFMVERNFILLMMGVFINALGSGVYAIAGMLLVLSLSGSVLYSGFALFAITSAGVLSFLIAPLANYFKYKNGLVYSNLLKALILFTIPILHYTVGLHVWYVIGLLFITALFTQFTYPIESTILPIIVGKDNVIAANSFLQTIREAMDIAFLAGAGILITFTGTIPAIIITATCLILVTIAYSFFTFLQPDVKRDPSTSVGSAVRTYFIDLKAGFTYIGNSLIPKMIFSIVFINLAMVIMTTNLPAFSLMKGSGIEASYGFYLAAMSIGIMIGTILASKLKQIDFGKLIIFSFFGTGVMWIGTALLPLVFSMILFSIGAISIGIINILVFSSIQRQVEVTFIGRVITLITSAAALGMPIGALIGGMLGEMFATEIPILICGVSMMLFSLSWLSSSALRKLPSIDHVKLFQESNVQA
ncbi:MULTISPECIES: MFS transporter [Bacillaceae]|uniref:MFS transporter n=2 Tax=Bacillaceae TaxID=186817 RepID=A0A9D5DLK5_9BACI|nr:MULTISPECIES: MFS transporter [Bacillaceae]KQL56138.1 MFS transporter [Alkalicoccobacillus plakortidis]MBG9783349.1 MFS transporter [Shouchella lehensis]RQW22451.1 MFS transporter [Bacillus sp. C1-1]TES49268.1 MFS transporter [Shouchella lehensis]